MSNNHFHPGYFVVTKGVNTLLDESLEFRLGMFKRLSEHACGQWSELDNHDTQMNIEALETGARIFSAWTIAEHKIYIITDGREKDPLIAGDCTVTTILLPSEY
ncbi:hypothetical protein H1X87_11765 [Vibrio parahaemolyticus]|uniref:hypothetical protein n=1 Tax=Vibrio parahaemolyticus TaxID=670 RepID=UPI00165571B7|nr:hypothetical protein [Vibrio parahaemolyticus]MBC8662051.1 hypothetical protein [Vibrio parahaemolyticus]